MGDNGLRTSIGVVVGTIALIGVSVLPVLTGTSSLAYLAVALTVGAAVLVYGCRLARTRTESAARTVLHATLVYLPVILAGIVIDSLI